MPQNHIVRNKDYYLNTLNIEADLLKKASDIAERMMVAFMRENKVEVKVDVDDIADKIIAKMLDKMPVYRGGYENNTSPGTTNKFEYDDGPVVIKTDKVEVKGKVGTISKTGDSISSNMDILEGMQI